MATAITLTNPNLQGYLDSVDEAGNYAQVAATAATARLSAIATNQPTGFIAVLALFYDSQGNYVNIRRIVQYPVGSDIQSAVDAFMAGTDTEADRDTIYTAVQNSEQARANGIY